MIAMTMMKIAAVKPAMTFPVVPGLVMLLLVELFIVAVILEL
jgi:hypothetical protein